MMQSTQNREGVTYDGNVESKVRISEDFPATAVVRNSISYPSVIAIPGDRRVKVYREVGAQ